MSTDRPHFDVVLIQPNITWVYDPFEHLGLAYLAASLRKANFTVEIVDAVLARLSHDQLLTKLSGIDFGVLGVTLVSHGYPSVVKFLEEVRKGHPNAKIAAGGHFATFAVQKIFEHTNVFDAIVLGEGESAFADLCRVWLRGEVLDVADVAMPGRAHTRSPGGVSDMDVLPFPARDQLRLALAQGATASITSSRGCYARCSFCTVHSFYQSHGHPRWKSRTLPNVIAELRYLHDEFRIDHFMFVDDNFVGPGPAGRQRALDFADAYEASGLPMTFHIDCRAVDVRKEIVARLQQVGLRSIFVGVESVATNDLILYRKGLKASANWEAAEFITKSGLDYTFSMIMFNPFTTPEDILANIDFLLTFRYFPRNPLMILNLYEGTDLNATFKDYIFGPFWDYRFRFRDARTAEIYNESMKFCRSSLALERRLSLEPGSGGRRRMVHRLRLLQLQDACRRFGAIPLAQITETWNEELRVLAEGLEGSAEVLAGASVNERRYLTKSPMDAVP
jgi:anaerobic magnesium-protoporphyrin IX monomethyl ester cyclase